MLSVGMYLADRYEIVSKVGAGGMSDVYKAKDHILGRIVAIKVLKQEFSEDRTFVSKFRTEAQSAAGLEHPNVVNIYDVGSEDGLYYIVMEYVEGITLKTYIEKKGQLSFKESASIAIQIARGIEAAHNKEIIHRDIKPQNIIISTEGKVKVTDFGIARAASSNTISADVMGSVHYASPEQARNGFVDGRSDIYSLGIVMYEMVTGRVPFDGDTTVAVAIQHLQEEMPEPTTYAPELPISFAKIILKCAQKNPDRRYQSVAELLADLRRAMTNPDEDFVVIAPLVDNGKTKVISKEELDEIGKERKIDAVLISSPSQSEEDDDEYEEDDEDLEEDDFDDEDKESNPKIDKAITIVAIVAAVLIVVLIIAIAVSISSAFKKKDPTPSQPQSQVSSGTQSEIPSEEMIPMIDLMGKTVDEANEELTKLGLGEVWVEKTVKSDEPKGTIVYQKDAVGEKLAPGSRIIVHIASDKEEYVDHSSEGSQEDEVIKMINVVGMSEDAAIKALEEAGFKVKTPVSYVESDDDKKDKVISQKTTSGANLKEGTTLTKGTEIVLEIGKGKDAVTIPEYSNSSKTAAVKKALEALGLKVTVSKENHDTVAAGNVIKLLGASGKEVAVGAKVKYGSEITIVESLGKAVVEPSTYKVDAVTIPSDVFTSEATDINITLVDGSGNVLATRENEPINEGHDYTIAAFSGLSVDDGSTAGTIKVTFYKTSTVPVLDENGNETGETTTERVAVSTYDWTATVTFEQE